MTRTRIKICGIRTEEALFAAADFGADAVGFMFVASSPRFIDPDEAFALMSILPPFTSAVGVFMDPDPDEFAEVEQRCPTPYTQLHGSESEKLVKACGPDIVKAVRFHPDTIGHELDRWGVCEDVAAILVDGSAGGQGESFEWSKLAPLVEACAKPIILAGGLTPDNVGDAIRTVRPYGVDVSSGVERARGEKDPALIEAFCRAVRQADAG
ncbi:MAG: N-(5'-phosphoribosyl)anthranilate isomerase [Phycisphaerae bacterium]|nr:MAG: N-(5'-phosphoribosyl)anthranilate isomerase [Phycisphaerae bacterium]